MDLFRKHKCQSCNKKVHKSEIYDLKYDTGEGKFVMKLCPACALSLTEAYKEMRNLYNDLDPI